ncbi:MAG TPA: hypothetical protein VLG38_01670 [Gammaproteobacteria bacterium]|nr:hypothetical protein [Gammaproteobacteria bacterium]
MDVLLFLLLPIAALSGWLTGRKSANNKKPPRYFAGLNYSLSQQPDKTVDALVQMPAIDDDTIETHLTLGSIFRRRGELERAIRLHQGLLQRPSLPDPYKSLAQLELARDYITAGVLDRAEAILLDLTVNDEQAPASMQHLLELYQQGKEWFAAINIAKQLQHRTHTDLSHMIAHFYCELAEETMKASNWRVAKQHLKYALKTLHNCPRAIILRGNIEQELGHFERAVKLYKHVATQNIDLFPVVINDIVKCYQQSTAKSPVFSEHARQNTKFRCNNCGFMASTLEWHCPSCKLWDSIKAVQ